MSTLEVGKHYRFVKNRDLYITDAERPGVKIWRDPQDSRGNKKTGTICFGDSVFVVQKETTVCSPDNNSLVVVMCKVMTSRQEMGWMIFYQPEWERAYHSWFEEIVIPLPP